MQNISTKLYKLLNANISPLLCSKPETISSSIKLHLIFSYSKFKMLFKTGQDWFDTFWARVIWRRHFWEKFSLQSRIHSCLVYITILLKLIKSETAAGGLSDGLLRMNPHGDQHMWNFTSMANSLAVGEIPVVLFSFSKLDLLVEVSVKNLVPFSHFLQTSSVSSL